MDSSQIITTAELHFFHSVDRQIFNRLVIDLSRDIAESKNVIALWSWFEEVGFGDFGQSVLRLKNSLLQSVADEAKNCLICMQLPSLPLLPFNPTLPLPLAKLLSGMDISLQYVFDNRDHAQYWITKSVNDTLDQVFDDIIAIVPFARAMRKPLPPTPVGPVSKDERTLFMTFSRGYPITKSEIRNSLTWMHGDCIESIQMQDVRSIMYVSHTLFAIVILRSASVLPKILGGQEMRKFTINGKHAFARIYVPKHTSSH
ncbi:hypothetical protein GIB67_002156 [Kingdonia uniflora]|uniref:Uncharacterized protein n=1 Tax=Kingdonia uniflora TaxID=39325 RepID=A0A7J7KWJ6_9MAGN|nr:hypothetical protein GIB67_002156 [Kingdonia uniflora]